MDLPRTNKSFVISTSLWSSRVRRSYSWGYVSACPNSTLGRHLIFWGYHDHDFGPSLPVPESKPVVGVCTAGAIHMKHAQARNQPSETMLGSPQKCTCRTPCSPLVIQFYCSRFCSVEQGRPRRLSTCSSVFLSSIINPGFLRRILHGFEQL